MPVIPACLAHTQKQTRFRKGLDDRNGVDSRKSAFGRCRTKSGPTVATAMGGFEPNLAVHSQQQNSLQPPMHSGQSFTSRNFRLSRAYKSSSPDAIARKRGSLLNPAKAGSSRIFSRSLQPKFTQPRLRACCKSEMAFSLSPRAAAIAADEPRAGGIRRQL